MIELKLGSSLSLSGSVKLPAGTWTLTSSIARPNGVLLASLTTLIVEIEEPENATHTFTISALPETTILWPIGNLQCDMRFEDSLGTVIHSPTFTVSTYAAITNPVA